MSSLLIKSIINLIFLVRWVLRFPWEITQKVPSHPQRPSCSAFLRPPTGSHILLHREDSDISFLFLLPCGRWVLAPPLDENCHPPPYLNGFGKKCQSCREGIILGFSYSDAWAWWFLAVRTEHLFFSFTGLQCEWEDIWSQKPPPETPP